MRDSEIEGAAQHGAGIFKVIVASEIVPEAKRDGGEFDAALAGTAVLHGVIAITVSNVHSKFTSALKGAS
jgi:hypothetical protein